ncbi:MAG: hypothetical protein P9L97_07625 [Candidatus Tenebribacter davisii]|nr:hypothetical protein [Candidatus Tenebribacter davisii]
MFTKKSAIYLIFVTIAVLVFVTSCMDARKGTLNANLQPNITITNYFGADSINQITEPQLFQQTIQWSGSDEDGVVVGYAFRILNEDGDPITTPGYDVITEGYDNSDENGWVKFYTPSADQTIPLSQSAQTTIWQDNSYATVNFPAANANGDSTNIISNFQVKCIDNAGTESVIASKYFQAESNTPTSLIINNIQGETVGTAIVFQFQMDDDDPVVGSLPYYFEYKLQRRDNVTGTVLTVNEGGYTDEWISTLENSDISLSLHSELNGNGLIPNEAGQDSTFLVARAIDSALILSEEVEISFNVKEGFYPGTVIYYGESNGEANGIYALGAWQFVTYLDEALDDILPSVQTSDGVHNATPFWYDLEEKYTVIGSNDLKIYMRWGYDGEFGITSPTAPTDFTNNPHKERVDVTLDELTGEPYFCEISYYDLRLDGTPYYYPPIPAEGDNLIVDNDGIQWLRIPFNSPIGQSTTITLTSFGGSLDNLYGEHTFTVRAVDLQGAVDETPHEFTFTVVTPIPKEEKFGVLIIDDDAPANNTLPELYVDTLYTDITADYAAATGTTTEVINKEELNAMIGSASMGGLHFGKAIISPTDMQKYKVVIYHSDNGTAEFSFWKEFEPFKIYLLQGGNLILSGGSSIKFVHGKCDENGFSIFQEYFGIPSNGNPIGRVSTLYTENPFFIEAKAQGNLNDIELLLPNPFNNAITNPNVPFLSCNGLGPVAYFNDFEGEVIYTYGCKEVADDPPGCPYHINPTQAEYDQYNGLPIALKYETTNNSCYIIGFPLSFMDKGQVTTMMNQILNEIP